jgi:hypothetical protein
MPADGLRLQRNPRTARTRHRHAPGVARTQRHRDRGDFVLGLHKRPAVFRQLAPEQLHDVAPRRDRVTRAEAHTRRDEPVGQRFVAAHHHLRLPGVLGVLKLERLPQPLHLMPVTRVEARQRVTHDCRIFSAKALLDQFRQLRHIEIEHFRQQPERINVLPFVPPRAPDRLHRQRRNRHTDVVIHAEQILLWRHVIGVVKHDATALQRTDVVRVAVVVKAKQHVCFVARAEHLPGANAYLENGRPARDRGRDRHEGHYLLFTPPGEPREEAADGLDSVLRISRDADDGFLNGGDFRGLTRRGDNCGFAHDIWVNGSAEGAATGAGLGTTARCAGR